jgi:polysaccharide biosynthesis/export protein
VFSILLWIGAALIAESPSPIQEAIAQHGDARATDYILGPDDEIGVWVSGAEDVNGKPSRIDGAGLVKLPLVGTVKAAGRTISELTAELTKRFDRYFQESQVIVSVLSYGSQPVSVLGEVTNPGIQQLRGRKTLSEMLALAGGLKPDAGYTATVTRRMEWGPIPLPSAKTDDSGEYSVAEIDLDSVVSGSKAANDIVIKPRDKITVPRGQMIYVMGEVERSGGFILKEREGISALQAISLAGGMKVTASAKHARILRSKATGTERKELPLNISDLIAGRVNDVALHPDDVLLIPNSQSRKAAVRTVEALLQTVTGIAIWRAAR